MNPHRQGAMGVQSTVATWIAPAGMGGSGCSEGLAEGAGVGATVTVGPLVGTGLAEGRGLGLRLGTTVATPRPGLVSARLPPGWAGS